MCKIKLCMPVLIGLVAGQLFAEGERPFKVANTVRVGYSDNLYRNDTNESGAFVTDTVDFSFSAALSEQTDLTLKSQLYILNDQSGTGIYPSLYMMLNHSASSRLLFQLSEYYKRADKSTGDVNIPGKNTRYDYFINKVGASADYVMTQKDRLSASVDHTILRHDQEIERLDQTTIGAGISWKRELSPERTFSALNLRQSRVTYDNRPVDTLTRTYLQDDAYFDQTDLSAGITHTFNQSWQGNIEAGMSYVQPNFSDAMDTTIPGLDKAENKATVNPLFSIGLVYSPSPSTRLTGDFMMRYMASSDDNYSGLNSTEISFGAEHDITARLMAKATARFANLVYDAEDATAGGATDQTEDRIDLDFRLTYKLNRIHFLEAGVTHRETTRDTGNSWEENRVDLGWRVELN